MIVICAWCKGTIREVSGEEGETHGICQTCRTKHFPPTGRVVHAQAEALLADFYEGADRSR
jgi:hypothetical protein